MNRNTKIFNDESQNIKFKMDAVVFDLNQYLM